MDKRLSVRRIWPLLVSEDIEHNEMYARAGQEQRHLPAKPSFLSHAKAWDKHLKPDD